MIVKKTRCVSEGALVTTRADTNVGCFRIPCIVWRDEYQQRNGPVLTSSHP